MNKCCDVKFKLSVHGELIGGEILTKSMFEYIWKYLKKNPKLWLMVNYEIYLWKGKTLNLPL